MNKVEELEKDIKKYKSITAITNTEGGKLLLKSLEKDVVSVINQLSSEVKTATHPELITLIIKLSERLTLIRAIKRAKKLSEFAQEELDFVLNEEV